jgi:hypothetical protein
VGSDLPGSAPRDLKVKRITNEELDLLVKATSLEEE